MKHIGVVRGGVSSEREVSLRSGATVLDILRSKFSDLYSAHDIIILEDGTWQYDKVSIKPSDLKGKIDVVFIALHGEFGEDGQIQEIFDDVGIPYTGSGVEASRRALDKHVTKEFASKNNIPVAKDHFIPVVYNETLESYSARHVEEISHTLTFPVVVKPILSGSSIGVSIVSTQTDLKIALIGLLDHTSVLVEEYITGREATVAVIENFKAEEIFACLPIEIRTPKADFFDFNAKYSGEAEEISPGDFSEDIRLVLQDYAKRIHRAIGLSMYSRSDFIVGDNGIIYFLEVNNLPGLTSESLVPKSLPPIGSNLEELIGHLIQSALDKKSLA